MKQTALIITLLLLIISCQPYDKKETAQSNDPIPNPKYPDLEAVDLGLSVKWGNMNMYIWNIRRYTDYYAWGELEIKDIYDWPTYSWCSDYQYYVQTGTYSLKITKYNTSEEYGIIDNKISLDAEDDVAHVELGGKWRIPTKEEWEELVNNCDWSYYRHVNDFDVKNGWRVKSRVNDNQIFLSSGYGEKTGDGGMWELVQSRFWTSSLYTEDPQYAWAYVVLDPETYPNRNHMTFEERFMGLSIRPVTE